jgi:hypothetical protein
MMPFIPTSTALDDRHVIVLRPELGAMLGLGHRMSRDGERVVGHAGDYRVGAWMSQVIRS